MNNVPSFVNYSSLYRTCGAVPLPPACRYAPSFPYGECRTTSVSDPTYGSVHLVVSRIVYAGVPYPVAMMYSDSLTWFLFVNVWDDATTSAASLTSVSPRISDALVRLTMWGDSVSILYNCNCGNYALALLMSYVSVWTTLLNGVLRLLDAKREP